MVTRLNIFCDSLEENGHYCFADRGPSHARIHEEGCANTTRLNRDIHDRGSAAVGRNRLAAGNPNSLGQSFGGHACPRVHAQGNPEAE